MKERFKRIAKKLWVFLILLIIVITLVYVINSFMLIGSNCYNELINVSPGIRVKCSALGVQP